MHHVKSVQNKATSFLGQVQNGRPAHVPRNERAADGVPTHPIHYTAYSGHFWLGSPHLFSAPLQLERRLCGLKVVTGQRM